MIENPGYFNKSNKNYVEHDNIYVIDTINYTSRYRFYNAIERLVRQKITLAARARAQNTPAPIIHIHFDCPDEKMYDKQTRRFFELIDAARKNGVIIETNTIGPTSGWASTMAFMYGSPNFRNMYEESYHYYYETNYDRKTRKTTVATTKTIQSPEICLRDHFCDAILMSNGTIKTR